MDHSLITFKRKSGSGPWTHFERDAAIFEADQIRVNYQGSVPVRLQLLDVEIIEPNKKVKKVVDSNQVSFQWEFNLGYYAGETVLRFVDDDDNVIELITLYAMPKDTKVTKAGFDKMLVDLPAHSHALLHEFGNTTLRFANGNDSLSLIGRLTAIRLYQDEIEQVFQRITHFSKNVITYQKATTPLHKLKKVPPSMMPAVMKHKALLSGIEDGEQDVGLTRLFVEKFNQTPDMRVFRYLKGLLMDLELKLAEMEPLFDQNRDSKDRGKRYELLNKREDTYRSSMRRFQITLRKMLQHQVFRKIQPLAIDHLARNVFHQNPLYERLYELLMAILEPKFIIAMSSAWLNIPVITTWQIFEYWCFWKLARLVENLNADLDWRLNCSQSFKRVQTVLQNQGEFLISFEGRSPDGSRSVQLTFQEEFRPISQRKSGNQVRDFESITSKQIPDFVLRVRNGKHVRAVVFDAKYSTEVINLEKALEAVSTYEGSLRHGSNRLEGVFILTPGYCSAMEKFFQNQFRRLHRFGGFRLNPECKQDAWELRDWLTEWFNNEV